MKKGMRRLLIGWAGALAVLALGIDAEAGERIRCGRDHRLTIEDLDMSPDPIERGQRVKRFRIRVRSDGSGECETSFEVREKASDHVLARGSRRALKPGVNVINLDPVENHRFRTKEHCLDVVADIERTRKPIDTGERFCARQVGDGRWSLKERGDKPVRR